MPSAPMSSSLRTVATMRRPRGHFPSIFSTKCLSQNYYHGTPNNYLSKSKRFYSSYNMDPFNAKTLLGRRRFSPASSLVPCSQNLAHNSKRGFTNDDISSTGSRKNRYHPKEARQSDTKVNIFLPNFASWVPQKSFLEYGPQQRFRILMQNNTRTLPFASMGTTRAFSTTTLSMNRFVLAPHTMKAGLPSARNVWLRNLSTNKDNKAGKESLTKSKDPSHDNKIQEFMDSTVSTVRTNVGSAEATIKRAVEELSTGDLLSVYGIV